MTRLPLMRLGGANGYPRVGVSGHGMAVLRLRMDFSATTHLPHSDPPNTLGRSIRRVAGEGLAFPLAFIFRA